VKIDDWVKSPVAANDWLAGNVFDPGNAGVAANGLVGVKVGDEMNTDDAVNAADAGNGAEGVNDPVAPNGIDAENCTLLLAAGVGRGVAERVELGDRLTVAGGN
jgi:hypothetical protein